MNNINKFISILCAYFCLTEIFAQSPTATATINPSSVVFANSKLLLGTTFDGRTGMNGNAGAYVGYFTPAGEIVPAISSYFTNFPIHTVRYPANGMNVGMDWKKTIGLPAASRPSQNILGPFGPAQSVQFGFDEYINWVFSKGVTGDDIQIMVPIYDVSTPGLTSTQLNQAKSNVAQYCADWVEYANAPNDGSNPRGGIDWAVQRAQNGHQNPYNIKIWNMGNEPWASGEFTTSATGCTNYLTTIAPIIDSMLLADPTIKISLSSVGPENSAWNTGILNSSLVNAGKIYAICHHAFPDETNSSKRVSFFTSNYPNIASNAAAKNVKMFIGDYAHDVPNGSSQAVQDLAVQWQGVTLCADYLLNVSQIANIERVNYWQFGFTPALYHPIRLLNGTYTYMPVAQFYEKLSSLVLNKSLTTVQTSAAGSDGNPYAVKTSAFVNTSGDSVRVLSVNRDLVNTHILRVSGLSSFNLAEAYLMSANAPSSQTYTETPLSPNSNGDFVIPPSNILVLTYMSPPLSVEFIEPIRAYPNKNYIAVEWTTAAEQNCSHFEIERSQDATLFQKIISKNGNGTTTQSHSYLVNDTHPYSGNNYYRVKEVDFDGKYRYSKIVSAYFNGLNFSMSPNPATTELIVSIEQFTPEGVIEVINSQGVLVKKTPIVQTSTIINIEDLPAGTYVVKLYLDGSILTKKVLIIK